MSEPNPIVVNMNVAESTQIFPMSVQDNAEQYSMTPAEAILNVNTDYEELENKPSINGVELVGALDSADLELQDRLYLRVGADTYPLNALGKVTINDIDWFLMHFDDGTVDGYPVLLATSVTMESFENYIGQLLSGKQDTLTFDNYPTEDSDNPVKSCGIYEYFLGCVYNLTSGTNGRQASLINENGSIVANVKGNIGTLLSPLNRETRVTHTPEKFLIESGNPDSPNGMLEVDAYGRTNIIGNLRFVDSNGYVATDGVIEGLTAPTTDDRAANKKYVDDGLATKQNTLTIDASPTEDSTNPVQSGGVFTALAGKQPAGSYQPSGDYASSASGDNTHTAIRTAGIPFGKVDSTSTSTVYTATVPGITALADGVCCYLVNGVVTSASGWTLNINGLGAKPVYQTQAAATRTTTIFNINYTALFVYNSSRVDGGCWDYFYGYDTNTNTIGYQIRTQNQKMAMKSVMYRYRLFFTSADGLGYVPANNSTSTNATASRAVCQDPIDPFGAIYYYGTTAAVSAGSMPNTSYEWQQNQAITLGYSFNRTGAAWVLTTWKPIYLKCAPQANGSAIMDATAPITQDLPTTADGKIYIFLGIATAETQFEMTLNHPVYYYDNGIKLWTGYHTTDTQTISSAVASALNTKTGTSDYSTSTTVSDALLALISLI